MLRAVHESVRSVGCLCGRIASLDSRVIVISPWPGCVLLRDIFGRAHVHLGFGIQHCLACGTDQDQRRVCVCVCVCFCLAVMTRGGAVGTTACVRARLRACTIGRMPVPFPSCS